MLLTPRYVQNQQHVLVSSGVAYPSLCLPVPAAYIIKDPLHQQFGVQLHARIGVYLHMLRMQWTNLHIVRYACNKSLQSYRCNQKQSTTCAASMQHPEQFKHASTALIDPLFS